MTMKKITKARVDATKQRAKELKLQTTNEERQKRKDRFEEIYNKEKVWEPSEDANMKTFCSLSQCFFEMCKLSLSELAVYPVLCANADFRNTSMKQLSLKNIARKTGLSVPTVIKAIEGLCERVYKLMDGEEIHLLERAKQSEGRRRFSTYDPWFIRGDLIESFKGSQFFFNTYIIESGIWSKLSARSKALYLIMRSASVFDFDEYCDVEGFEYSEGRSKEIYKNRIWEKCNMPLNTLCEMIGMSSSNIGNATNELIKYGLIDYSGNSGYIVYILPVLT